MQLSQLSFDFVFPAKTPEFGRKNESWFVTRIDEFLSQELAVFAIYLIISCNLTPTRTVLILTSTSPPTVINNQQYSSSRKRRDLFALGRHQTKSYFATNVCYLIVSSYMVQLCHGMPFIM